MVLKFTPTQMADMARLFAPVDGPDTDYDGLTDALHEEAFRAGVLNEALGDGLTMEQWELVRNPRRVLRDAVLSAGKESVT